MAVNWRKLAVMGALGVMALPEESEAMPKITPTRIVGAVKKVGEKLVSIAGKRSSAADVLVGKELKGKTIKDVLVGQEPWRYIVFDDDTYIVVTRQVVNDLARHFGVKRYMEKLAAKEAPEAVVQAEKSLEMRLRKAPVFSTRKGMKDIYERYKDVMEAVGEQAEAYALVDYEGKTLTMPLEYAKLLEQQKKLKIIEVLK